MSKQRIPSAHWWQTAGRLRPLAAEYIAKAKAVELAETGHECGHRFEITIRSAVHSGIAGEGPESHSDAGWKSAPHQAWFTSSAAADRYVAGYAPDVLRHAVTVVGPVEVEER